MSTSVQPVPFIDSELALDRWLIASPEERAIGYWRSTPDKVSDSGREYPWPGDHIDPNMPVEERERVAAILEACPVLDGSLGEAFDRLDHSRTCGSTDMGFEGHYRWPEGLSYYVRRYGLILPAEFIDDVERLLVEWKALQPASNEENCSETVPVPVVAPEIVAVLGLGSLCKYPTEKRIGFWRGAAAGGDSIYHSMAKTAHAYASGIVTADWCINGIPACDHYAKDLPDLLAKAAAYDALPWPGDHLDPTMCQAERERVATLLDAAPIVAQYMGSSDDRLEAPKRRRLLNGSGDRCAGGWLWPEGLSHYVRTYGLVLPAEMLTDLEVALGCVSSAL